MDLINEMNNKNGNKAKDNEIHIKIDKPKRSSSNNNTDPKILFTQSQIIQSSSNNNNISDIDSIHAINSNNASKRSSTVSTNNSSLSSTLQSPITAPATNSQFNHLNIYNAQSRRASLPSWNPKLNAKNLLNPNALLSPTNIEYRSILNELVATHNIISSPKPVFISTQPTTSSASQTLNTTVQQSENNTQTNNNVKDLELSAALLNTDNNDKLNRTESSSKSPVQVVEAEESSADTLLAARIGQSLLEQNQELMLENDELKQQLQALQGQLKQQQQSTATDSVLYLDEETTDKTTILEDTDAANNKNNKEIELEELYSTIRNLQQELRDLEIVHLADTRRRIKQIKQTLAAEYEQKLQQIDPNYKSSIIGGNSTGNNTPPHPQETVRNVGFSLKLNELNSEFKDSVLLISCFAKINSNPQFTYIGQTEKQSISNNSNSFIQFKRELKFNEFYTSQISEFRFTLFDLKKTNSLQEEKVQIGTVLMNSKDWNISSREQAENDVKHGFSIKNLEYTIFNSNNTISKVGVLQLELKIEPALVFVDRESELLNAPKLSVTISTDDRLLNNNNHSNPDSPTSISNSAASSAAPTPRVPSFHLNLSPPPPKPPSNITNEPNLQNLYIELDHLRAQNVDLKRRLEVLQQEKLFELQRQESMNTRTKQHNYNDSPSSSCRRPTLEDIARRDSISSLNVDMNQVLLELEENRNELQDLQQKYNTTNTQLLELQKTKHEIENENEELKKRINEMSETINKQRADIENLSIIQSESSTQLLPLEANTVTKDTPLSLTSTGSNINSQSTTGPLYPLQSKLLALCELLSIDFPYRHLMISPSIQSIFVNLFNLFQFQFESGLNWFFKTNLVHQEKQHNSNPISSIEYELNLLRRSFSSYKYSVLKRTNWQKHEGQKNCSSCFVEFGLFVRKHHCRLCGSLQCYYCCSHWVDLREIGIYTDEQVNGDETIDESILSANIKSSSIERICSRCFPVFQCGTLSTHLSAK